MFQRAWEFVFGLISWKMWCHSTMVKKLHFWSLRGASPLRGCRQSWEVLDAMNSLDLPSTQDAIVANEDLYGSFTKNVIVKKVTVTGLGG